MKKLLIMSGILFCLYIIVSLYLMDGNLIVTNKYSFESIEDARKHNALIDDKLALSIEADTLKPTMEKVSVWVTKSVYQEFYGFLLNINKENKTKRRVMIEKKGDDWIVNNWDLFVKGKMIGNFNHAFFDANVGDSILIDVMNFKQNQKIGIISAKIK